MNKPDWKGAPEWANYLAMDRDGLWHWYEKHPSICGDEWGCGGMVGYAARPTDSWRDSLEARP